LQGNDEAATFESDWAKSMRTSGFRSTGEIERFLAFKPRDIKEIVFELRNIVLSVCPSATERILWGGLSYHDPTKGGPIRGGICQIELDGSQVRVSFVHGVRLADPENLLKGERMSKRYLTVVSYEGAAWETIRDFVEQAAALAPSDFGPLEGEDKKED
jgi:hypothetical protein